MTQTTAAPVTSTALVIAVFASGRCRRLTEQLARQGYRIVLTDDAEQLAERAEDGDFAVAIVHVARNRPHHRSIVPRLARACGVLVLAGDAGGDGETTRIGALMLGADDVLPEDVGYTELLWRVQAVARNSGQRARTRTIGPLEIHGGHGEALLRGVPVQLTPTEFRLLQALARNPEVVQRREELHATVWSWPDADIAGSRTLDLHASRLRRKLARDGDSFVVAVRGVGYRLLPEREA